MRLLAPLTLLTGLFTAPRLAAQTTWYVDANGTPPGTGTQLDPYTSIQYAIDRPTTLYGHTLLVAAGEYAGATVPGSKALTVRSTSGPAQTFVDGLAAFSPSTLSGFTVRGSVHLDFGADVDHCIVVAVPGGDDVGIQAEETGDVRHCVVRGFATGVTFGVWGSGGNVLENTILIDCALGAREFNGAVMRYCAGVLTTDGTHWTKVANLAGDPGVWDASGGDFHLRPDSPCIDAGDPASPLDPDGSRADVGAIAYDATYAPGPTVYCEGKLNSQGCVPSIAYSGSASASSASPFLVTATNVVPHRRGFLFYGFAPDAQPFQGGTYCVLQPTRRTRGQDSLGGPAPCTGSYSYDFNPRIQSGADPFLVPGALVYAQYWFRDPADPQGFASGLSNGLCFGIAP